MDALVDVNVLFALVNERHAFHARACSWLDGQEPGFRMRVCRVVQMGLIRLLCNGAAMDNDPLTLPEAWKVYAGLATDPAVAFFPEPKGLLPVWIRLCEPHGAAPKVLTDAYLAAMAIQAGLPLASFDTGFARFPGLEWLSVKKH
jgi:toxin-antitoxin system PIN domain toxin